MVLAHPLILVVDDDDEFRSVLVDTLNGKGYRTLVATNGKQALELLRGGERPDLMLLDLWMPEMDGWQLREALGKDTSLATIPIIVMTAAQAQARAGLAVADVLEKPFSLEQLLAVLRRHLLEVELAKPLG